MFTVSENETVFVMSYAAAMQSRNLPKQRKFVECPGSNNRMLAFK